MRKKLSQTTIYLILICAFLLVVNVTLSLVLMRQSNTALRSMIESRMLDVSNAAAAMLDGDALDRIQAESQDTPEYRSILKTLSRFLESIKLEYIYCIRSLGGEDFVFLLDPDDDPGLFGEPIACTEALYQASLGTPSVDKEPYEDRWGKFYSAYTPVYNSAGEISGIVAVDFSAEWYDRQIATQLRSSILISAFSLAFAVVIIIVVAARFRRRFKSMLVEMNSLSDGIETLVHEISPGASAGPADRRVETGGDEIAELGERIRSLEEQLGKQITFVRSLAYLDGLTGLGNRAAYEEVSKQLDEEIRNGTAVFSVALIDLNGLKELNDRQGHEMGDQAILQLVSALREAFADARLYRIGGDEFIAVLDGPRDDIAARFDAVTRVLEEGHFAAAMGYSAFDPALDADYRAVFNRADLAMYNAKKEYYRTHSEQSRRNTSG